MTSHSLVMSPPLRVCRNRGCRGDRWSQVGNIVVVKSLHEGIVLQTPRLVRGRVGNWHGCGSDVDEGWRCF